MSPIHNHLSLLASSATARLVDWSLSNSTSPPSILNNDTTSQGFLTFQLGSLRFDPMNDYLVLSQNIFLIVSNFFMLPAIFLAVRFRFRGEAIVYVFTMLASSFYHLCDNEKVNYCVMKYETLQFLDFYCAIMTLWVTAIILANVPIKWVSAYHLSGAIIVALLLRNNAVGFVTFIVPAFCSVGLLGVYWGYKYYMDRQLPTMIHSRYFYVACVFSALGLVLFATQQQGPLLMFYGFTHSCWHVCMALAITFLLPNRDRIPLFYYRGKRYSLDQIVPTGGGVAEEDAEQGCAERVAHKRDDDYEVAGRDNLAFNINGTEGALTRMESICQHI